MGALQGVTGPGLIIFDCDGVIIDSEDIANRVIAANLTALGWAMDAAASKRRFLGMSIGAMEPLIETAIGRALPAGWRRGLEAELVTALRAEARLIDGARALLEETTARAIPWRIASNSSNAELAAKFAATGIAALAGPRAHSAVSLAPSGIRPKPAPDIFLHAAAAAGVAPARCIVLEDSPTGIAGAIAAGMRTIGFAPHGNDAALRAAGAAATIAHLDHFLAHLPLEALP